MRTDNTSLATAKRFSDRVANYVRFRPHYPAEAAAVFRERMGIGPGSVVADIGSGTGISAKMFLEAGAKVYGVEPNEAMRGAAEHYLRGFPGFVSVDGSSDATTLGGATVDLVVAAQAFHWFEPDATRREFRRILKHGGWATLMWNERLLETTPFLAKYEQLLIRYAKDYRQVRHDKVNDGAVAAFFGRDFEKLTFPNHQVFDLNGLRGRLLSSSNMPNEGDAAYPAMMEELRTLFDKHNESGRIKLSYDTNLYFCQL